MARKILSANCLIVVLLAGTMGLQLYSLARNQRPAAKPAAGASDIPPTVLPLDSLPSLGSPNAKIVMAEFSDFECPYCARYATETFPQIEKDWIETGKLRYVFVNNPLPIHKNAPMLAKAGLCASTTNHFWIFHNAAFEKKPNSLDAVLALAIPGVEAGCINQEAADDTLKREAKFAADFKVQATPSFAIGRFDGSDAKMTKFIRGALPSDVFTKTLATF
jgi:protein-disulfide isomerase